MIALLKKSVPHQPRNERYRGGGSSTIVTPSGGAVVDVGALLDRIAAVQAQVNALQSAINALGGDFVSKTQPDTARGPLTVDLSVITPLLFDNSHDLGEGYRLGEGALHICKPALVPQAFGFGESVTYNINSGETTTVQVVEQHAITANSGGQLVFATEIDTTNHALVSVEVSAMVDTVAAPVICDEENSDRSSCKWRLFLTPGEHQYTITVTVTATGTGDVPSLPIDLLGTGPSAATGTTTLYTTDTTNGSATNVEAAAVTVGTGNQLARLTPTGVQLSTDGGVTWT